MKTLFLFVISFLTVFSLAECTKQSRTVSDTMEIQEVFNRCSVLADAKPTGETGLSINITNKVPSDFGNMISDSNTVIFHASSGSNIRAENVAAFRDFSPLGFNIKSKDVQNAEVCFFENSQHNPRNALLVALQSKNSNQYQVRIFTPVDGTKFDKRILMVAMSDNDGHTINLKSYDVLAGNVLQGVIQLQVSNASGKIGKFPTLGGFQQ